MSVSIHNGFLDKGPDSPREVNSRCGSTAFCQGVTQEDKKPPDGIAQTEDDLPVDAKVEIDVCPDIGDLVGEK